VCINLWCILFYEKACSLMVGVCVWCENGHGFESLLLRKCLFYFLLFSFSLSSSFILKFGHMPWLCSVHYVIFSFLFSTSCCHIFWGHNKMTIQVLGFKSTKS